MYRKSKLYLVFEFVDKTLLEILEGRTNGLDVRIEFSLFNRVKL
jgi:hypothetical protein